MKHMSFLYVQQTFPTKGAEDKDYTLKNAIVHIYTTDKLGQKDTLSLLFYEDESGNNWSFPRFISNQLKVEAGMQYQLEIKSAGLPDVKAEATMPEVPVMLPGSLSITSNNIHFSLAPDSLAFLYEIFLFSDSSFTSKIFLHEGALGQKIEWKLTINDDWKQLVVYAFDKNMAKYMTTATSSFYSFNVYRPPVSTVNGGFGCFGAMNSNTWDLK
jgi:hypothetical protein